LAERVAMCDGTEALKHAVAAVGGVMSEHSRPEYHQLAATTVACLNKGTGGARRAVVERTHGLDQVHGVHRLSLLKIVVAELERMALEDAIQKVEVECRTLAALSDDGARANV
jgi:hypothetical protein